MQIVLFVLKTINARVVTQDIVLLIKQPASLARFAVLDITMILFLKYANNAILMKGVLNAIIIAHKENLFAQSV